MRCISGAVVFKTHNSFRQIWKEFGRYWKACTACKRKKERGKNGGGGGEEEVGKTEEWDCSIFLFKEKI